jgi:flavoprotein
MEFSNILIYRYHIKFFNIFGVKTKVNNNCTGCGVCIKGVCFIDSIEIKDNVAVISDRCLACGCCAEICLNNAIEVIIEDKNFIKKSLRVLVRLQVKIVKLVVLIDSL